MLRDSYEPIPTATAVKDGRWRGRDRVAVTFDDGYADNLTAAAPLLERHGVPATVFAVSGAVGRSRGFWWDDEAGTSPPLLTAEELAELADTDGITIGAHTVSHPVLSTLTVDEQRAEIAGSKHALEQLVGRRVDAFAYPHGRAEDYTRETVDLVRSAGFAAAYTTRGTPVPRRGDPLETPRLAITDLDGDAFADLLARVLGRQR